VIGIRLELREQGVELDLWVTEREARLDVALGNRVRKRLDGVDALIPHPAEGVSRLAVVAFRSEIAEEATDHETAEPRFATEPAHSEAA
jgi:hypothetical protein